MEEGVWKKACENKWKLMVIGDMNARVGESEVEDGVGKFGVSRKNENGRKSIELCTEKEWSLGNIFLRRTSINLRG